MSTPFPPAHSRRAMLKHSACGFGYLAFAGLAGQTPGVHAARTDGPLSLKPPMFPPRAKRVIFLFMSGAPSHIDTFDDKPELRRRDGQTATFGQTRYGKGEQHTLLGSPWRFKQHGESGMQVSSLFPHIARHVDDMCFIKSMHTNGTAHGQATLFMHTGSTNLVRPSMGSWIGYGLGTENQNLPGFVTLCPSANIGGARVYSSAFLPASYQGMALGQAERPMSEARFRNVSRPGLSSAMRERQIEMLRQVNQQQMAGDADSDALEAVVNSYETAFRMESHASQVTEIGRESAATLNMYGVGAKGTDEFGRQCLMARRLSESGVRFVQVNYTDNSSTPKWDQHRNLKKDHPVHAQAVDQPIAALLTDLKQRGLLEDTLVWWGGEFGRTPYSENGSGRDHNPFGFTQWLAGGGVKPGFSFGATDELGLTATEHPVHTHDLHATILRLMGLDHEKLTYRYSGRDFRLTDVAGKVVEDILL